jgi:hypothetical protein
MKMRFLKASNNLSETDKSDIMAKSLFSDSNKVSTSHYSSEYSQNCYEQIRFLEELAPTFDYLNL